MIAIIILSLGLGVLGYLYYQERNRTENLEAIYSQNVTALNDKLKKIRADSTEMYHKYVEIQENLAEKEKLLKERDETVLYLNEVIVNLNDIIEHGAGDIIPPDTPGTEFCYEEGTKFTFSNVTQYYSYWDTVFIGSPISHSLRVKINPFTMTNYLTRNDQGVWSGYTKIDPPAMRDFINITGMRVIVERDEFLGVESHINRFRLSVIPNIGLFIREAVYLKLGLGVLINDGHYFEYQKGVGNSWHYIDYGYKFDFIE